MRSKNGFSLIELIIASAFFFLVGSMALVIMNNQSRGALESDAHIILSRLADAQSRAIAGVDGTAWGIYFDNASTPTVYALFQGTTYTGASSTYYLSSSVEFGTPASGATTTTVFTKLTGRVSATSTIVVRLKSSTAEQKTITVSYPEGHVSVQ